MLLPLFFISIPVALGITYLSTPYFHLIIVGVVDVPLFLLATVIFGVTLTGTWAIIQLVLLILTGTWYILPYYALRNAKPKEEESKGGYRLEEVKQAKSETIKIQPESIKPEKFYCLQCGTEARSDANFCPSCGAHVAPPEKE